MKTITHKFKFNSGMGATLCLKCDSIIESGVNEHLLCVFCQRDILETIVNTPNDEELGKTLRQYAVKL